jgi:O-antigen/teichoic acid export membrane protein
MLSVLTGRSQAAFDRLFRNPLVRRVVRNSGYLFSATGLAAFMGMLQGILAARLLGPADFGVLGAITTFASTINRFASFRMSELIVRYVSAYQESGDCGKSAAVFKVAAILEAGSSLLAFGLIWLLAPLGADYFAHNHALAPWFLIYGSIVLANLIYESANGLLQVFDRFRVIAMLTVAQSVFTLGLIGLAYIRQGGLMEIVLAYMAGKFFGGLSFAGAALWQARRAWGKGWWLAPVRCLESDGRSLFTFAFSTNLSSTVSLVAKDSEVLWVSAFLGTAEAGYYKLALALANILQLPVAPLPKTTYPELAREVARGSWENVRYVLRQGSRLAAAYSLPVMLGLFLFGRWMIAYIYKPEFLPAYPALLILLVGYTFVNIFYWNRVALLALSHSVFPTVVNFIGMLLKVAAIYLWLPRGGYLAFAGLLSGYYLFTVGLAAGRVQLDLKQRTRGLDQA